MSNELTPEERIGLSMEYMRAAVRAQRPYDIRSWTQAELQAAFCIIPPPAVAFDQWFSRMQLDQDAPADGAPATGPGPNGAQAATGPGLTDDMKEANQSFIDFVQESQGKHWEE